MNLSQECGYMPLSKAWRELVIACICVCNSFNAYVCILSTFSNSYSPNVCDCHLNSTSLMRILRLPVHVFICLTLQGHLVNATLYHILFKFYRIVNHNMYLILVFHHFDLKNLTGVTELILMCI